MNELYKLIIEGIESQILHDVINSATFVGSSDYSYHGGIPVNISIIKHPTLHISDFTEYVP